MRMWTASRRGVQSPVLEGLWLSYQRISLLNDDMLFYYFQNFLAIALKMDKNNGVLIFSALIYEE